MIIIENIAKEIVNNLKNATFNDVTDSSGYYTIKEFNNGFDRMIDVYKSNRDNTAQYVVCCVYEDDNVDYYYTEDLSEKSLLKVLKEIQE